MSPWLAFWQPGPYHILQTALQVIPKAKDQLITILYMPCSSQIPNVIRALFQLNNKRDSNKSVILVMKVRNDALQPYLSLKPNFSTLPSLMTRAPKHDLNFSCVCIRDD
jgi:hypothetical protein